MQAGKCCSNFQNGKKEDPGNYRPVSLTSLPVKIIEKIVLGVTKKYLKDNAITDHSQHRFTRLKSCLMNLSAFYDKVTQVVDQGKSVDVIFWIPTEISILFLTILLDKMSSTHDQQRWVNS